MESNYGLKYLQVAEELINRIETNKYSSGEPIPSERELIEEFNLSRITIRKAIEELVYKGYLEKVQGKGTFVKSVIHRQNLFSLTSCKQDILNQGMSPSTKVIRCEIEKATSDITDTLKIGIGDEILTLERIYYANGTPVNLTETHLPLKYFPNLELVNFNNNSLYQTLETKYNLTIKEATRTIDAIIPTPEIARYLELEPNEPVLFFQATTIGLINGVMFPFEFFNCYYKTSSFKFYIHQVR